MYLDFDTTPVLKSRYLRSKTLPTALRHAMRAMSSVKEGQVGIYENHLGKGFAGYVIRYPGEAPYFEEAKPEA